MKTAINERRRQDIQQTQLRTTSITYEQNSMSIHAFEKIKEKDKIASD